MYLLSRHDALQMIRTFGPSARANSTAQKAITLLREAPGNRVNDRELRGTYTPTRLFVCTKSVAARVTMPLMTGFALNVRSERSHQGRERRKWNHAIPTPRRVEIEIRTTGTTIVSQHRFLRCVRQRTLETSHVLDGMSCATGTFAMTIVPVSSDSISRQPPNSCTRARIPATPTPVRPAVLLRCVKRSFEIPLPLSATARWR
jgi:hypothetical protein